MKKNNLFSGVVVLCVGSVLAKIFSAIYRIALTRILGGEGIGIYQLVFPFYSLCVVLATAGLPMAISKVVSKKNNCSTSIIKRCFNLMAVVSLIITLILIMFSGVLANVQGEKNLTICYMILAPTIILVSFSSVLRGYFQGKNMFTPSALSNILEQFIKLVFGLALSLALMKYGLKYAIIGAILSIGISELISLLVLLLYYRKAEKTTQDCDLNYKQLIKEILPITLTNIILPIASFVDSLMVVNLLRINFSKSVAVFMYGVETGAVNSLISLPTIFSFAIACVLMPNIATNSSEQNSKNLTLASKIILIITLPCVLCFIFFPKPIIHLLYANSLSGYGIQGLNIAYRVLSVSSLGIVFLALNQIFSVSLQAVENRLTTIKNLIIAVFVKFFIQTIFLPSKLINIYALAIANTICYFTVYLLNRLELKNNFKLKIDFKFILKLSISCFVMLISLTLLLSKTYSVVNTILAFGISAVVYLILICILKIVKKEEIFKKTNKLQ